MYPGAEKPLKRAAVYAPDIHGESGIDGTDLLPEPPAISRKLPRAVDAMADALMKQPAGSSYLVATGALTNVAALIEEHPQVAEHLKGLSIMGGAFGETPLEADASNHNAREARIGNITQWAEFNIFVSIPSSTSQPSFLIIFSCNVRRRTKNPPQNLITLLLASFCV